MACRSTAPNHESAAGDARRYWRSLEELAGSADFEAALADEFPRHAAAWDGRTDRRRFLELMAASLALGGMQGCSSPPPEPIMPYVRSPRGMTAGKPLQFATAMPRADGALGLVVTSHMGRPTKVEGNPLHPASLGATDALAQASILTLYDPDRSQTVLRNGQISTWDNFLTSIRADLKNAGDGSGMRIVSGPVSSPTLLRQREMMLERFPQAKWHEYEPTCGKNALEGAQRALGEALAPVYKFADAEVVVSLDADFLSRGTAAVRNARDFMQRRGNVDGGTSNRLYVIESTFSPTGAAADHRLPLKPSDIDAFAAALGGRLGMGNLAGEVDPQWTQWLDAVAEDLERTRGRSLIVTGEHHASGLHAFVLAMNAALGNFGTTVNLVDPIAKHSAESSSLGELAKALNAGDVEWLIVIDANPVYDAPGALEFANAIRKARDRIHFGLYADETADSCTWHVPAAHFLESWSDARSSEGAASIVQPLIAPLYGGKTYHELLSALVEATPRSSYDIVRETWQAEFGEAFEERWHKALSDGVIGDAQFEFEPPRTFDADLRTFVVRNPIGGWSPPRTTEEAKFALVLLPDPSIGDGRMANNGWLQELPKPITSLTWDNAVLVSPADAQHLGLEDGDLVRVESGLGYRNVTGPVCITPGQSVGSIACHFGYGRTGAGRTGTGLGFNAYKLLSDVGMCVGGSAELSKVGGRVELARTQKHHAIDGRNIVHTATLETLQNDPKHVLPEALHHEIESLFPPIEYPGFAWGMAIDLSKCMGCNACMVACQAENNVPVVGKEQVLRGREMHWLRMDVYFEGDADDPRAINQPMLCQHCEKAPCEVVCPVAATTHSDEGLNEMTYNRCIGTRYCSNNCPYKVRRFNFFEYNGSSLPVVELGRNPNVTVRSRGVMEKCTYCVQRIDRARIEAKKQAVGSGEGIAIPDGTLVTACQQACPTQAIVFGDINDPESRVSKLKADPRNYGVLSELGTVPRTTYLARIRNPHPRLG